MTLKSQFLATLCIAVGESHHLGDTPAGGRRIDVFQQGPFQGPKINGVIVAGGSDALLRRTDGAMQPDVRLTIATDDKALVYITCRGIRHGPPDVMARIAREEPVEPQEYYLRNVPFFETASPRYDWLNRIVSVGIGRRAPRQAFYDIYEIL